MEMLEIIVATVPVTLISVILFLSYRWKRNVEKNRITQNS